MGLREMNATRTRRHISDAALDLFLEHGYDAVTMEDVAERAEIGTSTLYRYFPTKELLATAPLGEPSLMGEAVLARPDDEPPHVALGHALVELLEHASMDDPARGRRFGELIRSHPRTRARLFDWFQEAFEALVAALAERAGTGTDDLGTRATAWLGVLVLQQHGERMEAHPERDALQVVREVMTELGAATILPPSLAPR